MGKRFFGRICFWVVLALCMGTAVAETGDDLYRQGRYEDAKQHFNRLDMEHPRDLRYRYNRGCAAYQAGDHQEAMAAFSSVLRRLDALEKGQDDGQETLRAKATYNMGNVAFQQGDFDSAVRYYKEAIAFQETRSDAQYNLELALRELKEREKQEGEKNGQETGEKKGRRGTEKDEGKEGEGNGREREGEKPPQDDARRGDPEEEKRRGETDAERESRSDKAQKEDPASSARPNDGQAAEPRDLSGELKARRAMEDKMETGSEAHRPSGVSAMDKERAEALLDNVDEDRSRFLRFQVPEDKAGGVPSGKDW